MRKLDQSRAWRARGERVVPGCAQTFSKGPISFVQGVAPSYVARARGAYVWDVDGNRYIDYILGLGPVILGHADEEVDAAVVRQLADGVAFSLPHPIEVEVSELICQLVPCAEMVRFGKNGSDVTAAAVRLSRAVTGRDKVARCGYHGWQDWYIGSTDRYRGVPETVRGLTIPFPYNNLDAVRAVFEANPGEIACVILEPVTFDLPAPGYLAGLKELCAREGALLVFDETITGFRIHLGGAQAYFGVTPDLACFGKALANGLPLAAIAGRAELMRRFEDVFFSFTHGGEALSLAAALATLRALRDRDGNETLWRTGSRLQEGTRALIGKSGLAGKLDCAGLGPWTTLRALGTTPEGALLLRSLYQQEVMKRGILTHGNHMMSLAHTDAVVDETLAVYEEVFPLLAEAIDSDTVGARLEGTPIGVILRS